MNMLKCSKFLKLYEFKNPTMVEDESVKVRIPINNIKFGDVGYKFEKLFKGYGKFEGCIIEIIRNTKDNKSR